MIRTLTLLVVLLFAASSANAAEWTRYRAVALGAVRVIDGDTVALRNKSVRIVGLNAPEIGKPRCDAEKQAGLAAKQYGLDLIANSQKIQVRHWVVRNRTTGRLTWARDKYGRYLVDITVDGRSWADVMVSTGHAKPWDGKGPAPGFC
jgi:micrococcal nuclease